MHTHIKLLSEVCDEQMKPVTVDLNALLLFSLLDVCLDLDLGCVLDVLQGSSSR